MSEFLHGVLSFPTVIFSFFLCLCFILWLLTAVGLLGFESGEIDLDLDVDINVGDMGSHADIGDVGHGVSAEAGHAVGLLTRFGLNGVPITLVISFLSLFGWIVSYLLQIFLLNYISVSVIYYPLGFAIMVGALVVSVYLTAQICKPLRASVFKSQESISVRHFIGRVVTVRSSNVSMKYGEAVMDDGGAGLILRVRAEDSLGLKRGDQVVLLEYLVDVEAYRVISEDEFKGI